MDGAANPSFSPDIYSIDSTPTPEFRQRIPRSLSSGKNAVDDGIFYQASWAGMDRYAVETRSNHVIWRVVRVVVICLIFVLWVAMFVACIVILARGSSVDDVCLLGDDAGHWYDTAISYQVYPASFQDSDGDGFGDLKGIISRLDYLEYLGVDTIWLGPMFESSGLDLWMDITNFTAVDGVYGTIQDFEELVAAAHNKNMKLILEFIPNHSSDKHPWFQQSRQSAVNDYSDYYIWADGRNGGPPTGMMSTEGGSAWQYDSSRQQWYVHTFMTEEPDLNYHNPMVVRDVQAAMTFWLGKGVDGFYMRHINHIFELMMQTDRPVTNEDSVTYSGDSKSLEQNMDILNLVAGWRQLLDEYKTSNDGLLLEKSKLLVVDTGSDLTMAAMVYYNKSLDVKRAGFPFNFMFLNMTSPLNGHRIREAIENWIAAGPVSNSRNWAVGTVDVSRIASRYGGLFSRAVLFLVLMLPGTPVIYYGDEIGMMDGQKMNKSSNNPVMAMMNTDRELTRLPMQWSADVHAGFTDSLAEPWIPVSLNASEVNVKLQRQINGSHLVFIQQTIRFRRDNPGLFRIEYSDAFRLQTTYKEIIAFTREIPGSEFTSAVFAAINVADYEVTENFESIKERIPQVGSVVVATDQNRIGESIEFANIFLQSGEAILVQYTPLERPGAFSETYSSV